ncbi:hypothetical protein ACVW1A_008082 [Bradyrhizobium sp. LB1.3]
MGDLGGANDLSASCFERKNIEHDVEPTAVLSDADRLVLGDRFVAADPVQDTPDLGLAVVRHNDVDRLADGLRGGIAEQMFGGLVPAGDDTVERLRDDGVIGGFDDGAVQGKALAVVVAIQC